MCLLKVNALHVKKRKRWRGANPRPMVLNDSALPLRHSNLQCLVQFINHREEIKYNSSEWCSGRALAFKTIGRGFAPRQRFVFFTRRRRRRVSIFQSDIGGLPPASALSFSHVNVGDAFQFINHMSRSKERQSGGASG